jgi:hypothetical protein
MTAQCCTEKHLSHGFARRLSHVTPSVVPGLLLLLLPKCPMCIAAWLTLATGLSISATAVTWVRIGLVALWVVASGQLVRRRLAVAR